MLRRDLFGLLAAPFVRWRGLLAGALAADPSDAAPLYEAAFRHLGRLAGAHAETLGGYSWTAKTLGEARVDWLLGEAGPALDALRAGAKVADCRWGPDSITDEDFGRGRLDLANGRAVDLLGLSAERHARAGDWAKARADLDAALTLARRVGAGGVIMHRILACSFEVRTWQAFGRLLPILDRPARRDLAGWVDGLPGPEPASGVVAPEARFVLDSARARLRTMGPTIDDDGWGELQVAAEERPALMRITGGEPARLLAHLEASGPAYAELAWRLDLPRPGVWEALTQYEAGHAATFPIAAGLVDHFRGVRQMRDRIIATRAMARAGLTLLDEGEAAFAAIPDPFGVNGAGFGREPAGRATLLRSALRDEGRPAVELTIGVP